MKDIPLYAFIGTIVSIVGSVGCYICCQKRKAEAAIHPMGSAFHLDADIENGLTHSSEPGLTSSDCSEYVSFSHFLLESEEPEEEEKNPSKIEW